MTYKFFSVIIPVYNTDNVFLSKCFESVICQTFKDFEIIIIDDGSNAITAKLCDIYSKKFTTCKLIHQQNSGVSFSRNTGISISEGEYIIFLDSDDFLFPTCLEEMNNILVVNKNTDILMCAYNQVDENDSVIFSVDNTNSLESNRTKQDWIEKLLYVDFKIDISAIFSTAYSNKLFSNVLFPDDVIFGEDFIMKYELFKKADTIMYFDKQLMSYRIRSGSAMRSSFKKEYLNTLTLLDEMINNNVGYKEALIARYVHVCFVLYLMKYNSENRKENKRLVSNKIKKYRKNIIFNHKCNKKLKIATLTSYFGFNTVEKLYLMMKR